MVMRDRLRTSASRLLPAPAPLPSLTTAFSRRAAIFGGVVASGALAAPASSNAAAKLSAASDAALIAQADALKALRARELRAWHDLPDDMDVDEPGQAACSALSDDVRAAGEALAETPAVTPAGLAAKASAMLALVGRGRWAETEAFSEHHELVASVLRDGARVGGGAHA